MMKTSNAATVNSVPARIVSQAERERGRDAVIFLDRGETVSGRLTYDELVAEAGRLAGRLVAEGLSNRAVMISLPAGIPFVTLFLACLWARVVAIPAPYPAYLGNTRLLQRLQALLSDARPAAIVTDDNGAACFASLSLQEAAPRILTAAGLMEGDVPAIEPMAGDGDAPAIVQYTSGSTSAPRGVVITHANLFANQLMIESAFEHDHRAIGVSWLPHFHDMGLLGGILQPFFIGGSTVLMDPLAFVQKPIRWLRAIDRFRAAIAGGPSFAYDLCVRHCAPADLAALDLSCWNLAFCGAEPIRPAALAGFAEKCAPARFDPRAFTPCYGLAEATLIVSCVKPGLGLRRVSALRLGETAGGAAAPAVSCGSPVDGCEIRLLNEASESARPGESGEICVSGPHVSPGLWNGADGSVTPFPEAFTDEAGARFIRTGDVGAILDGELVPIDRIKDIIILYGQKLHAADVEASLLAHPLAADLVAACAFAVDGANGAQLILLCEMDRRAFKAGGAGELAPKLAKLVAEAYGALPRLSIFPYGSLPRTSSGKIQRLKSKADWLGGEFVAAAAPSGDSA